MKSIKLNPYFILIGITIIFILLKLSYLSLPHFWDEAWSYATAVHKMYDAGPTLLPGNIDVEATRGHPLFFYFAASSWMKIFGATLIAKHSFALFIAVLSIVAVFHISYKLANIRVAVVATILLIYPLMFFIQSTLLLPEILVALLSLLSIYYTAFKKYWQLAVSLSLLLLTKESGVVMGFVLGLYFLYVLFKEKDRNEAKKLFIALLIPFIVIVSFFLYQYSVYGWFFFPEHIGMMSHSVKKVINIFNAAIRYSFLVDTKFLFLVLIASLIAYLKFYKKTSIKIKLAQNQVAFFLIAILFFIFYAIFCGINFFTTRYLLPEVFIGVIAVAFFLDKFIEKIDLKWYAIVVLLFGINIIATYTKSKKIGDCTLGYKDAVMTQKGALDFLANNVDTSSQIATFPYQMLVNMKNPACGFLPKEKLFLNSSADINDQTNYIIIDNIESVDYMENAVKDTTTFSLEKRIENGNVWAEIYKRK